LARLFHSADPCPFRERDLDVEAERFIVEWAQDVLTMRRSHFDSAGWPGNRRVEYTVAGDGALTTDIFLVGWWPVVRRRRLYRRLGAARVEVLGIYQRGTWRSAD
jgi:hypothetical protein